MKTNPEVILSNFVVPAKPYTFQPINNGLINDTYLVISNAKSVYILQRINHNVFTNIEGLMQNIDAALSLLKSDAYNHIALVKTKTNKTYHTEDGYWRLMSFIDESTTYNTTTNTKIAFEAGKIVGEFHKLLSPAETDTYTDTIPQFHDLRLRKDQFEEALENANETRLATATSAIQFAQSLLPKLIEFSSQELPVRVCHNDTKLNNILFSKSTEKALCLIDLDTLMKGYFYYDFGDAVRTIANTADEDERDLSKITFNKNLFEAFIDGLTINATQLTKEEIASLPLGAVFMPFIHGLRALTDYLENDKYYKTAYENQNIDRCISLFDFSKKALKEESFMQHVLAEKFSETLHTL
tara:strand:- start:2905 stop:3969 length:1065 start_codon:yes stop_codon:yes gene_type:complete